ncbi:MAG: T9SS type A sorting domain-containing protein [Flavobacteriales bacterium]|nr:T9SS type A sorting domain-containing protein [Flavobacteriales bacterium]
MNLGLFRYICVAGLFLGFSTSISAQKGPGGISVETGSAINCGEVSAESTCGVWLDASTLDFADGTEITNWEEVSISADCDNATVPPNALSPLFRNDPAFTINGLPTITFEDGRYFVLSSSDDLNTTRVTYDKMVFLAFRTSEEVQEKQMIYEEGGTVRGFNIMIDDGLLIIGAYDKANDNDDGLSDAASSNPNNGRTPAWGYSYISNPIQPNTTYILAAQFKATTPGVIGNNSDYFLRGWLNATSFGGPGALIGGGNFSGFNNQGLLGSLYDHPNPCGLGAVNDDTVDRDQVINGNANTVGTWAFKGKLAEVCYYKDEITEAQRLIVQNYLAAKYLANLNTEDWYEYEVNYGQDVIGIGQRTNNADLHNLSQGNNPFRISASSPVSSSSNQYYFTGHNKENLNWTDVGVPNNSTNIERLERIWRVDRSNFVYNIKHEIDTDALPSLPAGYTQANSKFVLLIDETSENIPDFTLSTTVVREIGQVGTAPFDYEIEYNIPDGAFYTFGWLRPEVNFVLETDIGLESNPTPNFSVANVELRLNYTPIPGWGDFDVDFAFIPVTATLGDGSTPGDDFYYNSSTPGLTSGTASFFGGNATTFLQLRIINDTDAETPSTEEFTIQITGTNSPPGEPALIIGPKFELAYTIFDDDPPPKISFPSFATNLQVNESAGTIDVAVVRDGNATGVVTCNISVRAAGTTARSTASGLDPQDYDASFQGTQLSFLAGPPSTEFVTIPIINDNVDEALETLELRITQVTGAGASSVASLRQTIEIVDDDIPIATFGSPSQSGFESIGAPSLLLTLDPISSRDVAVDFTMNPGTATFDQDYAGTQVGTVLFPAFTSEAFAGPFFVFPDGIVEPEETVLFNITETTPEGGSAFAQSEDLTYTILEYSPFEWTGVAGVGRSSDNIVWIDATQESIGSRSSIANRSPLSLTIGAQNGEAVNTQGEINGQNALVFNGSSSPGTADFYEIENNSRINTAGTVDRLAYFFVFRPDAIPTNSSTPNNPSTSNARLIYEQGGGTRGVSIYLHRSKLWFHAWNNANDDGNDDALTTDTIEGNQAPWGNNANRNNSVWAASAQNLSTGQNYVVSCIYDNFSTEPLRIYVNGTKGTTNTPLINGANPFGIGRLWGHGGKIGLGAVNDNTRFHFSNGQSSDGRCAFAGKLSEFISFHEPELTESRRIIIENHLSAKYNIALQGSDTPQIWDISDPVQNEFKNEVAGIGEASDGSSHTDSSGPNAIFRLNSPVLGSSNSFAMWGHNGEDLTNTWPYTQKSSPSKSAKSLPPGILERSGQVWKIFETGDVTSATIQINFSASDSSAQLSEDFNLLKLLVHSNTDPQDFSTATVYDLPSQAIGLPGGNVARFTNIPITNGMYLTLGNTSDYSGTPLPIELLSFDANLNGSVVDLEWITASEINNDYFLVERAGEDLVWEPLLTVPGAENSNTNIKYSEVDRKPLTGISYYRLKQVDFDGQFTYSDPVSVFNRQIETDEEFFLFPNPSSTGSVFIRNPENVTEGVVYLRIYDMSGKAMKTASYEASANVYQLDYDLIPGMYIVQFSNENVNQTKKLVVR